MRLHRVWLERFRNLNNFTIVLHDPDWPRRDEDALLHRKLYGSTDLRFLAGLNGAGKSNLLNALGLIFSHLGRAEAPPIMFDLEYERGGDFYRLTNAPKRMPPDATFLPGVGVAVWKRAPKSDEWEFQSQWAKEGWLPERVVAYSTGPATGIAWALDGSVAQLARERMGELPATEAEHEQQKKVAESYLDNPYSLHLGYEESLCAALALLAHNGVQPPKRSENGGKAEPPPDVGPYRERRETLLERVKLDRRMPLAAFCLQIRGDWAERLTAKSQDSLRRLLQQATRRTPVDQTVSADDGIGSTRRDFLAVFDALSPNPEDGRLFGVQSLYTQPHRFFEDLLAWKRQGALAKVSLILQKERKPDATNPNAPAPDLLTDRDLSDGEALFLGRYGLLLMLSQFPETLVLLDEPDTHYNDRWKIDLVWDVCTMMNDDKWTSAFPRCAVLVATHSPVTLSDADRSQVYLFTEQDGSLSVETANAYTLGADISDLSAMLAQLPSTAGSNLARKREKLDKKLLQSLLRRVAPGLLRLEILALLAGDDGEAEDQPTC
ncbi:MAG TPA: hypothetical protein VD902_08950 [Symbiobacteriaceae bacterium]|nr:hypothetical protein [Symbiobacteriaceae bacterium]